MKKRKNPRTVSPAIVKILVLGLFSFVLGLIIWKGIIHAIVDSPYFRIRTVMIDPSVPFIHIWDLGKLEGRNIFSVDLKDVQQRLSVKYPQVSDFKVLRKFPDQIYVEAKQRYPFAQLHLENKTITLDEKGVILSTASKQLEQLPLIFGVKSGSSKITPGFMLSGQDVQTALKVIKAYQANTALSPRRLSRIEVENLSEINVFLDDNLSIIVDRNNISSKLEVLSLVLAQAQLDVKTVNYIDLRFKEPIIGKKPEENAKSKGKKPKGKN